MLDPGSNNELPPIPAKRYFTIGEVSDLCAVKPHVLRYWEQEFQNLKPVKRRGNRRYYQRHDVMVIRQIRTLLYEEGFTIGGARLRIEGEAQKLEVVKAGNKANAEVIRGLREELEGILALLSPSPAAGGP
jgi:DNA-binding transcriptional MerR regulator